MTHITGFNIGAPIEYAHNMPYEKGGQIAIEKHYRSLEAICVCTSVNEHEMNPLEIFRTKSAKNVYPANDLRMDRSVIGKMSSSVKQSLLGRLRTLLKRMHVG